MATLKQIDELVPGDKFLCLDINKNPIVLTVKEVDEDLECVIVEETIFDISIDEGYYCVTDELS